MKKFKILGIALGAMLFGATNIKAESVYDCLTSKAKTCGLTADLVIESAIEISGDITLDLNGYSITPSTSFNGSDSLFVVLRGGNLTINDSSAKKNGLISTGMNANIYAAVKMTKTGEFTGDDASLVVNGGTLEGYYYAITGNGSRHNTSVTINGGIIKGLNTDASYGIYNPQNGTVTINGGTVTGNTGLEIRGGKLIVTGGTITGTGSVLKIDKNDSGPTTNGVGIAIAKHNTLVDIDVQISGGTVSGMAAIYETNPNQLNDASQEITVLISGGKFTGSGELVLASESNAITVIGGTFNKDVTNYLKNGYIIVKDGSSYVVNLKMYDINIETSIGGKIETDKTTAGLGQTVSLTSVPNTGYILKELIVKDSQNNVIAVTDNKFIMPNDSVTISAVYEKLKVEVKITELDSSIIGEEVVIGVKNKDVVTDILLDSFVKDTSLKEQATKEKFIVRVAITQVDLNKLDESIRKALEEKAGDGTIAEYFNIAVNVYKASDNSYVKSLSELTEEIELMILLPENLQNLNPSINRTYNIIREHNGKVEIIPVSLSEDGKYLTFKSQYFSGYALSYQDIAINYEGDKTVVANPKTGDNITLYVAGGLISLIGLGVTIKRFN